jgi:hypothetical protein
MIVFYLNRKSAVTLCRRAACQQLVPKVVATKQILKCDIY